MTLRFTVLGYEIARVTLDIEHAGTPSLTSVAEKGVEGMSSWWIQKMLKRRH